MPINEQELNFATYRQAYVYKVQKCRNRYPIMLKLQKTLKFPKELNNFRVERFAVTMFAQFIMGNDVRRMADLVYVIDVNNM